MACCESKNTSSCATEQWPNSRRHGKEKAQIDRWCCGGCGAVRKWYWGVGQHTAAECVVAQRPLCIAIASSGWQRFGFEIGGPAVVAASFPEACCSRWSSLGSSRISSKFRASKWRQRYCYCTAAQSSCNRWCCGFVVPRRGQDCRMGQRRTGRSHSSGPRSAQKCAANSRHKEGFCCNFGRW